jgi:hypothetical protein
MKRAFLFYLPGAAPDAQGFGFVTMATYPDALAAIGNLNGSFLAGFAIQVRVCGCVCVCVCVCVSGYLTLLVGMSTYVHIFARLCRLVALLRFHFQVSFKLPRGRRRSSMDSGTSDALKLS